MKKLLAIGLCLMFLGCSDSPVDESGRPVAERDGDHFNLVIRKGASKLVFRYALVDGHEYLVMYGSLGGGLTHSPKCKCLSSSESETTRQSTQGGDAR